MAQSALWLIAERGVRGTSIADVLERSDTPRGSVYHHFPGGKDEIVLAAMDYMATEALAPIRALAGEDVAGVIVGFLDIWRSILAKSAFGAGCATAGVAVSAETDQLAEAARRVFDAWVAEITDLFVLAGIDQARARDLAWMLFAATEGAVIFARAEKSMRAVDLVERQMLTLAQS
jgi:TetR/AcrR family transcriptional repressor of lmrAB and yxaGH operons